MTLGMDATPLVPVKYSKKKLRRNFLREILNKREIIVVQQKNKIEKNLIKTLTDLGVVSAYVNSIFKASSLEGKY